jgi:hypothetical protein
MNVAVRALALFVVLPPSVGTGADDRPATFTITTKKKDDAVEVRADKEKTLFVVKSPSGIGRAVVARAVDRWPDVVVLRLHLSGLESFGVSNGTVAVNAAVSSQGGGRARLWKDGDEKAPLDAKSEWWMEIRSVGADGKPAAGVPLKGGYFEMTLPKALFEGNPKSLTLDWIDFFRN